MFQEHDGCYEDHGTFVIVDLEFEETLQTAIVPDFWLFVYEGQLYSSYPPGNNTITPIKMRHEPDREIWPSFPATWRKDYSSYPIARKNLPSAVQHTDFSEDGDLEQKLETNGNHLRRSMRRKKKPVSLEDEFDIDLHDKPSFPLGGLCSPTKFDKEDVVPSSDEDPSCDDVEEHGQSLSKYLKRKRISSSADTSCDGSDLRDVDETPSLPLSLGGFYTSTQYGPGDIVPSPVDVHTFIQSDDESNGGTLNESANGAEASESQCYQDAGLNRTKKSNINQAPKDANASRRASVEKPSSDGYRSQGQIDSALLVGRSVRRAPVEHPSAIKIRARDNSIGQGQPGGKRLNAEPVASGSRFREDSLDQILPGCSYKQHNPASTANGSRSRPIHQASPDMSSNRRSTEKSTCSRSNPSKGHLHQAAPVVNSNRNVSSEQPAASGTSHTRKSYVNPAPPRCNPGVLVPVKQPISSGSCSKEGGRKEALPVSKPLGRPSVEQLIASGSRRASVAHSITPVRRVPEGLINQPPSHVNNCHREVPADAVLRVVYEMNENVNNIQRQVSQIAGRIDTYRPETREELDPLNELPLSTLEDLVAFENVLAVDKKKCEALARFVRNIGGVTEADSVKRAWKEVVAVNVRALCNWNGVKRGILKKHKLKKSPIVLAVWDGLRKNSACCHSTDAALQFETIRAFARSAEETRRNTARAVVLAEREQAGNQTDETEDN